jgi:hypothetical protein
LVLDVPTDQLRAPSTLPEKPVLFTLKERIGDHARIAANGLVAGDAMGNGHFLTSGGMMVGTVAHSACLRRYFEALHAGVPREEAFRKLCREVRDASEAWLQISKKEFIASAPINFGKDAIEKLGLNDQKKRAVAAEVATGPDFGLEVLTEFSAGGLKAGKPTVGAPT